MNYRPTNNQTEQNNAQNDPIRFEIISHLGSLGISKSGWKRELNIVSWNGKAPRLDIRDWNPEHTKMGRGVGLNGAETENMLALLQGFDPLAAGI